MPKEAKHSIWSASNCKTSSLVHSEVIFCLPPGLVAKPHILLSCKVLHLRLVTYFVCCNGTIVAPIRAFPLVSCTTQQSTCCFLVLWKSILFDCCIPYGIVMILMQSKDTIVQVKTPDLTVAPQQHPWIICCTIVTLFVVCFFLYVYCLICSWLHLLPFVIPQFPLHYAVQRRLNSFHLHSGI